VALNDAIARPELALTFNAAAHVKIAAKRPKPLVWTAERVRQRQQTGIRPSPVMVWAAEQTGQFLELCCVSAWVILHLRR
jgi:hypothetical protein